MMARASHPLRLLAGLARKNTVNHIVRHPISFLLTFYVIPIVILSLLLALPNLLSFRQVSGAADPAPIKALADTLQQKLVIVRPADVGSDVQRVIDTFTKSISTDKVQILKSDAELFDTCSVSNGEEGPCHAAVSFYDSPGTASSENKTWQYTIRSDVRKASTSDYLAHKGQADDVFLPLQLAINNAITNSTTIPETFMFARTKSHTDATAKQDAANFIGNIFTFAIFACFFIMIYKFTSWITQDRDSGMSRLMDSMGGTWCLPLRVLSWIFVIDLACLPLFIIFGVLYAKLAFPSSDVMPLIGWQILLGFAINSSSTFAAAFFSKPRGSSSKGAPPGFLTSQYIRMTRPCAGRQGSSESVAGSGTRKRSEWRSSPKPAIAEASKETPFSKAYASSEASTETFFGRPKTSQNARRTNFTSSSLI